jgi:hypothetical protein
MITRNITDATMSPSTGPFSVGDKIKVYGPSKHSGRTATIQKVGRKRLTVEFHDKLGGRYVGHGSAHLIDVPATSPIIDDNTTLTEERTDSDLTAVLQQLAITTATAIKTYEPAERDKLFHTFVQSLDQYLGATPRTVTPSRYRI